MPDKKTASSDWENGERIRTLVATDIIHLMIGKRDEDQLSKLTRYEASHERSLQRALFALERRQGHRRDGVLLNIVR